MNQRVGSSLVDHWWTKGSEAGVCVTDETEGQRQAFGSLMNQRIGSRLLDHWWTRGSEAGFGSLMNQRFRCRLLDHWWTFIFLKTENFVASSITSSYLNCSTVEAVMYCIAYILFWLELHVTRTCGHKNCKFVRKLSKDNINGKSVPVPLSGHEADPE